MHSHQLLATPKHLSYEEYDYTAHEDFENTNVSYCIGDPSEERFNLVFCNNLLQKQHV
ncbi:hypothetical protein HanIR_Chr08g0389001 [Helianthus annuus]|nr:hypothetical protein HanIR_Chr08g0389001 [Helianthus annuus]